MSYSVQTEVYSISTRQRGMARRPGRPSTRYVHKLVDQDGKVVATYDSGRKTPRNEWFVSGQHIVV